MRGFVNEGKNRYRSRGKRGIMGKKLPYTPNSQIRSALRVIWMRSRERAQALRNTNYCCCLCGVKQSSAKGREVKLDVHHGVHRPDWVRIFAVIREELLQKPEDLWPLCKDCHDKQHEKEHEADYIR